MGGSPGRAQGRQRGGLRLERGGGACPGSCVGWCVSGRVGEERRGRQVSRPLLGVADRSQGRGGRY